MLAPGVSRFVRDAFETALSGILNKRQVDVLHDIQRQVCARSMAALRDGAAWGLESAGQLPMAHLARAGLGRVLSGPSVLLVKRHY